MVCGHACLWVAQPGRSHGHEVRNHPTLSSVVNSREDRHVVVQCPEVPPGHGRVVPPSGVPREVVQAGGDVVYEGTADADEHTGGPPTRATRWSRPPCLASIF